MEIVQYVRWSKPGEREILEKIMDECESEMEFRRKIATTFDINNVDASIVFSRFKNEFIKKLKNRKPC